MPNPPDPTPTVVVVGSLNADLLIDVERLPRAGETVTALATAVAWGGKGANQAVAAAGLGARTIFVGAVGRDSRGTEALDDLARAGVDTTGVDRVEQPTGTAHVLRDAAGENLIVVVPGANHALSADHVRHVLEHLDVDDAVVVSNLEVPDDAVLAAATAAAARGWRLVLNPGPARILPPELLALVAVLTPNAEEVLLLGADSVADLLAAGTGAVVVTRGADGVDVHDGERAGGPRRLPALPVDVVDTVGAGDAFTAGLAVALASGARLDDAALFGTAAAAIAVTGSGARGAPLDPAAVRALLADRAAGA
ncbi:ribokinase [Nocardioides dongxiaopingii]|uniref:ribokinase n=1 Tax=Nocardioides dongxiaopingii TaxID=2576036 RepID=UPI0010C7655E|nr:ribokinase [Nocardioides dongxiaopingii]